MKARLINCWKNYRSFLVFLIVMCLFRSAVADWNTVPSGSMKPTILEGDRILINKMAYDLRVPFSLISLVKLADPVPGDIVVFESEVAGKRLVKRVVGVPGDAVAMRENVLYVNGTRSGYQLLSEGIAHVDQLETFDETSHVTRHATPPSQHANFGTVTVPAGHYLVLGDNRDQSADSRVIGFVPRQEIIGRSRHVVLSLNYDNFYVPRPDRFFQTLQ